MNTELQNNLKTELKHLQTLSNNKRKRLASLEPYRNKTIFRTKRNTHHYYYVKVPKGSDSSAVRRYLGGCNNEEVRRIQEARLLELELEALEKDIKLLLSLSDGYADYDRNTISKLLPKTYRSFENTVGDSESVHPERAKQWLRENKAKKDEFLLRYPEKHPESFKAQRADGIWFRSRAEAMIATEFDSCGIPYVYELPHYCNGKWIKSDFTALSTKDYTTEIILEHLGLMDEERYRHNVSDKIADYMAAGYKPNINLFFTFDNPDQSFSLIPLRNIIETWLIP